MTPRVGVKTTPANGNAPFGALVPKQGPHFFAFSSGTAIFGCPLQSELFLEIRRLINLPRHRNIQMPQNVLYFRIPQA